MNNKLDYIELICKINPNLQKHTDVLIAYLTDIGFESFMETEKGVNAYIAECQFNEKALNDFEKQFSVFKLKFEYRIIKDENWNEKWTENYFEPIIFGTDLVVRASFHKNFPKAKKEIIIDPKTAFGTGYHATTYMLLEEILKSDTLNKSVLDMGTGTGILAILSKMQGSAYTFAVDNDIKAVKNTSENILINNTPDIEVGHGDITILKNEKFDIIYENIWKNTVINDMPILAKHLNSGGVLLTSGFYYKEYDEVKRAGEDVGLIFQYSREKDGWAVVKFVKE
ncbi:MAG: 50S ribosomal protein L11 methyltransferase [Candidatus Cloacimonetes bacterium]|nr:50S ribosomal protein L11 methyltransferase [Candidatus Cloacimonadota bacterium]